MTGRRIAAFIVGVVLLYFLVGAAQVVLTSRTEASGTASAAVVLGAAQYDGTPSPVLARRLDTAARLYLDGQVSIVVVTGGGLEGDRTTEAKAGYDYLRARGVPDEALRLEVDGTSTYTELAATRRFLDAEGIGDVFVVTDPYHAQRATMVAGEVGLDARPAPTDGVLTPSRLLRETVAVSVGRVLGFRRLDALAP